MSTPAWFGGLALAWLAQAGPPVLDLRAAVQEALTHNPEVAQAQAAGRAESAGARGANAWPEPMLSYQAWQQPLDKPFDLSATHMHMFGVRQMLPLTNLGGIEGRMAEKGASARWADAQAVRLRIQAQVAHGLVSYWLMRQELEAHEAHVLLSQRTLAAIRARFVGGQARQADLLRAETELHRLHSSIQGLRENVRGAAAFLNAAMGRPPETPLPPPAEPERTPPTETRERPEVQSAALREEQAQAMAQWSARSRFVPELMVGLDYMLMPGMPDAYSLMLQIPLPILSGKRAADAERSRLQLEEARFAKAAAVNAARYEAADARARAQAAMAQLNVLEKLQLPAAQRTLAATESSYGTGQSDLVMLLEAQTVLLDTQLLVLRQRAALGGAIADLRRALGVDLLGEKRQ